MVGKNEGEVANVSAADKRNTTHWNEEEKEDFLKLLKMYGKNWQKIAENLPNKTQKQVKNYYQNYNNKLNLKDYLPEDDKILPEKRKRKRPCKKGRPASKRQCTRSRGSNEDLSEESKEEAGSEESGEDHTPDPTARDKGPVGIESDGTQRDSASGPTESNKPTAQ